ncbi:hypothetical protein Clacol_006489 [Clathrus columnatus]|uniref:Bacteriophage T5 Orf172 DNA-binding domain-containing protein n=1 Tax=Clathrus columnatus TaxID=1419009 RepID=A0AAV5AGJ0_9AGAM|nr:hypothetical protein Clacol_006489 [Clathrus columnatus]
MSKSSSSPQADPVHNITTQINQIKLSGDRNKSSQDFSRIKPSLSQIPASLQPAHGAQLYTPSLQRIEMPVPMVVTNNQIPMHAGESLTMGYARLNPLRISYAYANHPPILSQSLTPPQPANRMHLSISSTPSTPTKNTLTSSAQNSRPRASSTPTSPTSPTARSSSSPLTVQCAGTTKAGKRCTRQVKTPPLVSYFMPSDDDEPIERLCFQHNKEVLQPTGFYSRKAGGARWVEFSDWIPSYLNPDTQAALRVEMERPHSNKDEDGYIYAYEIRDDRTPNQVHLKVGRSVTLVRRLDQWSKQCTSKEVVLRGWWPGTVESESSDDTSLLKGKIKAGEKGPFCHRLERLIHIELADLSTYAPYLKPGFPKLTPDKADLPTSPGRSPKPVKKTPQPNKPCLDCGTVHKEVFSFQKIERGPLRNGEWEKIVQPVVNKWGRFVSEYL